MLWFNFKDLERDTFPLFLKLSSKRKVFDIPTGFEKFWDDFTGIVDNAVIIPRGISQRDFLGPGLRPGFLYE
jgi:hypothetical protein